jgi:hypothetical protein
MFTRLDTFDKLTGAACAGTRSTVGSFEMELPQ